MRFSHFKPFLTPAKYYQHLEDKFPYLTGSSFAMWWYQRLPCTERTLTPLR
jgi:hypothetical protein